MECVRQRMKDVDFERSEILICDGKGAKDRVTIQPEAIVDALQAHLKQRHDLFNADQCDEGKAAVDLPDALART